MKLQTVLYNCLAPCDCWDVLTEVAEAFNTKAESLQWNKAMDPKSQEAYKSYCEDAAIALLALRNKLPYPWNRF